MSQAGCGNTRRRVVLGGAAVGVAALAGWAWQRDRAATQTAASRFWTLTFDSPDADGQALAASSLRGRPLLVNFWATWCTPCIEELPLLSSFYAENSANGWQLLGLAVDKPAAVRRFLARSPVGYAVAMAQDDGNELMGDLGNWRRGIPFSVLFGADGKLRRSRMGMLDSDDLADWRDSV